MRKRMTLRGLMLCVAASAVALGPCRGGERPGYYLRAGAYSVGACADGPDGRCSLGDGRRGTLTYLVGIWVSADRLGPLRCGLWWKDGRAGMVLPGRSRSLLW